MVAKPDMRPFKDQYPFRSHYLGRNGYGYHYLDEGSGEPVVMLHGNPTWSFYYRKLVESFSPNYRCIVPDHLGCGLSDVPDPSRYGYRMKDRVADLTALIRHLNLGQKITLIVHDWGGFIGMAYAVDHPETIGRLVVLNTAAFFPPDGKSIPMRLRILLKLPHLARLLLCGLNAFALGAAFMAPRKRLTPAARKGLTAPYNSWQNRIATLKFVQDIPLLPGHPTRNSIHHVSGRLHALQNIPMLICWGRHDFVFDTDYFTEWKRRFPEAENHLFDTAGHYILEDEPDAVIGRIRDFIHRHPIG